MDTLEGPSPISTNGQVAIPKAILASLGWERGDSVMFEVSEDDPQALRVLSYEVVRRRYRRGEAIERLEHMSRGQQVAADRGEDRQPP